jgi:DNA-binding NarL/FixJ family response regulator
MRVVVVDGQADVRAALALFMVYDLHLQVVGTAADLAGLWTLVQEARPDLLFVDWGLLGAEAGVTLARLHALCPRLQVIALSGHPEVRQAARAAGADAFVSKADSIEQLVKTLHAVLARWDPESADGHQQGADGGVPC